MKSRISFFDEATSKKDLTRFAPLWVLYTISLLITTLPSTTLTGYYRHPVMVLNASIEFFTFTNMIYAAITASLLFGELFNSRLCHGLHAMPATRTARFGSHVCTGLAFSFIPNLLVALLMMPSLEQFWFTSLLWLTGVCLQYVFFFGIAVFCVMCTGSRFAMVMIYTIINFFSLMVKWFVSMVFLPEMPGVMLNTEVFELLCPAMQLLRKSEYMLVSWNRLDAQVRLSESTFEGFGESWRYLGILGIIGIVALVAALLLYHRRKLECAGDFIAAGWLKPIFLILYTLFGVAFWGVFGTLMGKLGLLPGLVIGFFTGKMLLERTIRVFKKKNFLQAGIFAAILLIALWVVNIDLFGIVRYVPPTSDIERVTVYRYDWAERNLAKEESKEIVRNIHTLALANDCDQDCGKPHFYFEIEYHMRDGRTVTRYYYLCEDSEEAELADSLRFAL